MAHPAPGGVVALGERVLAHDHDAARDEHAHADDDDRDEDAVARARLEVVGRGSVRLGRHPERERRGSDRLRLLIP